MNHINANNILVTEKIRNKILKYKNISIILFLLLVISLFTNKCNFNGKNINNNIDHIAVIDIDSIILKDSYQISKLDKIKNNDYIKAVIINIDSPGGAIVPSENLYYKLKEISTKKPVISVINSIGTSGAYMVAIASEYIIARHGSIIGSIGVLVQSYSFKSLADKIGIKENNYKSSSLKAYPSLLSDNNPNYDQVIDDMVLDSYNYFKSLVIEGRDLNNKNLNKIDFNKIFDGRIFTGSQAKKLFLIDNIGSIDQAKKYLKEKYQLSLKEKKYNLQKEENNLLKYLFNNNLFEQNLSNLSLMAILK